MSHLILKDDSHNNSSYMLMLFPQILKFHSLIKSSHHAYLTISKNDSHYKDLPGSSCADVLGQGACKETTPRDVWERYFHIFSTDFMPFFRILFNSSSSTFGRILDHKCATKVLANNKSWEVSRRNNGPRFCL